MGEMSDFAEALFESGLLVRTGVDGLYGRSDEYESIVVGIDRLVGSTFAHLEPERVHFPPVVARATFEETNYLESFPDLMGSVHVFRGDDRSHRDLLGRRERSESWQELLEPAEVVLASAACHVVYPLCSGELAPGGRVIEIHGYCFRHEPSTDPARMMAFRMHEVVRLGDADQAARHRDEGLKLGADLLRSLGLEMALVPANDPFFGRVGKMLASEQLEETLKIEGVTTVGSAGPTAVMSGNCHRDHFSKPFGISLEDGSPAHSACVAFGVDRVALALVRAHGVATAHWPDGVRELVFGAP